MHGVSVLYGGKGGVRQGVSLFQGERRVISTPSHPHQGAALRRIVRPGWWTFSRMEREMECGIVESPSSIPWDQITSNPTTHTHTHTGFRFHPWPGPQWSRPSGRDSGAVVWTDVTEKFQWAGSLWFAKATTGYLFQPLSIEQCNVLLWCGRTVSFFCSRRNGQTFCQFMTVWHTLCTWVSIKKS